MITTLIIFFSFFCVTNILAQEFAIIQDVDGYANIRNEPNIHSKVIDKLKNGHIVYTMSTEGNWVDIDYSTNKNEIKTGFVYKNRLKSISEFESIPFISKTNATTTFKNNIIQVVISEKEFDKQKHKYQYVKDSPNMILTIDGKEYWGTDGEIPQTEYKDITITLDNAIIRLPKEALENLYEPNLQMSQVNYNSKNKTIYISSMNSDGAGGYLVVWKIENGIYKERFIAYGF